MPTAAKPAPKFRPRAHRFALESRQLFDGAALVEAAAVGADMHHEGGDGHDAQPAAAEQAQPAAAEPAAPAPQRHVYVIDQGVANWQQLAAAVPAGGEVVLLTPQADGVAQLAAALQGQSGIASLSIFSHAAAGELRLGAGTVDAGSAARQAAQWQAIGAALGSDADILLYGCDLAHDGTQLLQRLAELTGADVAASTNATGAARAGGDWTLEAAVGAIETRALVVDGYSGLLANPSVTISTTAITVIEASANNAAGVSSFAFSSGWAVSDGTNGNVTVTATLSSAALGQLQNGTDTGSTLSFSGTSATALAWLNALRFNATEDEIGNTALSGTLSVAVSAVDVNGATLNGTTRSIAVTVTPSNDPATLVPVAQSVGEGATTTIAAATLGAFDPEVAFGTQVMAQLVYRLNAEPQHGYLTLNGARLGVDSIFTQADVIAGRLAYVHTATGADQNLPDAFTVRLNDGATPVAASATAVVTLNIAAVNLPPTVSGTGSAYEGQPANAAPPIGSFIVAGDGGDNEDPATLRVLITALPSDGALYFDGVAVGVGFEFAYADRARLTYANLSSREPGSGYPYGDSFGVLVSDGGGGTGTPASTAATIAISVRSVNDDPVLDQANAPLRADVPQGSGVRSVVLQESMFRITDVDSSAEAVSIIVTDLADLSHGQLQLAGKTLTVGSTFTLAQLRANQVSYVQTYLAGGDLYDTFKFQVVDNATSLFWDAAGAQYARAGGVHAGSGAASPLSTFNFTVGLDQTADPDYDPQPATPDPTPDPPGNSATKVLGADASLGEGGAVVLSAASLSYSVTTPNGVVDPQQIVYTVASLDGGPAGGGWNGTLQRWNGSAWVALGRYDTFTQADLNAGNGVTLDPSGNPVQPAPVGLLRYVHDGASEDFESSVRFSVSAGVLVDGGGGSLAIDRWEPTFAFRITPVNDLPTVTGSTSTVIREGGTAYITTGQLAVADADDAISTDGAGLYEAADTLPGGGANFAYNNGAGGGLPLRFQVVSLPTGGTLESSSDNGVTWTAVTAGQTLDASLLTGSAATTGLRFVSDGLETRQTSFQVRSVDRWGALSATTAAVTIQITNVNDPPAIAARPGNADPTDPERPGVQVSYNEPLYAREGTFTQITSTLLQAFDPDSTDQQVQYRITAAPTHGSLAYSTNGTTFTLLGAGSAFTKADVAAGRIYYVQRGSEPVAAPSATTPDDKFVFTVADGDKEQAGNEFWIYFDPLANDAPVVSVTSAAIINIDSAVAANNPVAVFRVADADLDFVTTPDVGLGTTARETDFLQVTVRLLPASGSLPVSAATYAGVTLAPGAGAGAVVGVDLDGDGQREHTGNGDYLVLSGTRQQVNDALAGLTLTFADDRDALYRVQVIADDRLRDADGKLLGTGANGGAYNQPASATASTVAVPSTEYDWYTASVPTTGAITGNLHSTFVQVRASSVNDEPDLVAPATLDIDEDTLTFIGNRFGVSDAESAAFGTPVSVTLGVNHGTLHLGAVGTAEGSFTVSGRTVTVSGDGSASVTLTGAAADIDALLKDATRGLRYQAGANVNGDMNAGAAGDVTLTMSFDDSGSRFGGDTGSGSQANNGTPKQVAITLVPVNDAPVLSGTTGATVRENAATGTESVRLLAGGDVSDVDLATTPGLDPAVFGSGSLTVSLTDAAGYRPGDILFVDLDPAALPAGVTVAGGVGTALTVSFDADTTLAQVRTVLNALAYRSSSDNPTANGTDATRSYRIELNDGNNAQPGGNAGGPARPSNALVGVLTLEASNDPPAAVDDTHSISEDSVFVGSNVITGRVSAEADSDPDNPLSSLRISAVRPGTGGASTDGTAAVGIGLTGSYGVLRLDADGTYRYDLDNTNPLVQQLGPGQTLTDTFSYTLADPDGGTSTAVLRITIAGTNDAPVAQDDAATVDEDTATPLTGSVWANDTPGDGTPAQHTVTWGGEVPAYGTITRNADGSYSYTLDNTNPLVQQLGPGQTLVERFTYTLTDADGDTSSAELVITIRGTDDLPVAVDDSRSVDEDTATPLTGSVRANDTPGDGTLAQHTVTWGGEVPAYGTITRNADGSYSYTLDNANPLVQRLVAGETLVERFTYTLTDADGDTSSATLVITIRGTNDVPTLVIDDGNGGATGQASVSERGLADADGSQATQGRFVVSAPDGLQGVSVGGTFVSAARLAALGGSPLEIVTARGVLTLTGYDAASGAVSWRYVLSSPQAHAGSGGDVTDDIALQVLDRDGDRVAGTLRVLVLDDAPLARDDAAQLGIALPRATASGNLLGGAGRGDGDVADRLGADAPVTVVGIAFESRSGSVGAGALRGQYGTLRVEADGRYVYAVDDAHPAVAALGDGKILTERFTYTIRDADGSTSTATLVVTIRGNSAFVKFGDQIFPVAYEPQQRDIAQAMAPGLFVQHAVRDSARESLELTAGMGLDLGDELQSQTLLDNLAMSHSQHVGRDGVAFSQQLEREARQLLAQRLRGSDLMAPTLPAPADGPAESGGSLPASAPVQEAAAPPATERIVVPRPAAADGAGAPREAAV
uniref:VCBS domain-containing protein n=1 Tax=Azohydromonas aeria TaxID=2590212 RepID=UPI0012F815BF